MNRFKEVAEEDTPKLIRYWYEWAVDEQKKELKEFKKKAKAQEEQTDRANPSDH